MGRTIFIVLGVLLAIWVLFTVVGMVIAALKFLVWIGLLAFLVAILVTVFGRFARSR